MLAAAQGSSRTAHSTLRQGEPAYDVLLTAAASEDATDALVPPETSLALRMGTRHDCCLAVTGVLGLLRPGVAGGTDFTPPAHFLLMSGAVRGVLGYSSNQLLRQSKYQYYHPDDVAKLAHADKGMIADGRRCLPVLLAGNGGQEAGAGKAEVCPAAIKCKWIQAPASRQSISTGIALASTGPLFLPIAIIFLSVPGSPASASEGGTAS